MTQKPSTALAGIAAAMPVLFSLGCCALFPLAGDMREWTQRVQEMGPWFYMILAVAPVGALIAGISLFLAGRGMRVSSAVAVGAAALPWLCGSVATRAGTTVVEEAAFQADPAQRAMLVAKGISEVLGARVLGGWLSTALLCGVAFGLAIAAIGQRAPNRSFIGAALGAAAALPLLGLGAYPLVGGLGAHASLLLPGLAGVVALAMAGAAAGRDERGRSASLAAAAPFAMVLALLACAIGVTSIGLIRTFAALAAVDTASRPGLLVAAAEELVPVAQVARWGALVGLLPVVGIAGWAAFRSRPSVGRIVGGVGLLAVAALVVGLDGWSQSASRDSLRAIATAPWDDVPGFTPVVVGAGEGASQPVHAVVAADGAHIDGDTVPLEADALAPRFQSLLERDDGGLRPPPVAAGGSKNLPPRPGEPASAGGSLDEGGSERRYGLRPPGDGRSARDRAIEAARNEGILGALREGAGGPGGSPLSGIGRIDGEPQLALAIDAGLSAGALRAVVEAANRAGARSLKVIGTPTESLSDAQLERMQRVAPLLVVLAKGGTAATDVLLEAALPEGHAAADPVLYHAEVGAEPTVRVEARAGSRARGFALQPPGTRPRPPAVGGEARELVYFAVGDGASAESVFKAAAWTGASGRRPVLVAGSIPGHPDEPAGSRDDAAGGLGLGGLGLRDDGTGTLDAGGGEGLEKEAIQRTIQTHLGEVRACYEKRLARDPKLEGRVTVTFVISPSGSVRSATVRDSALQDPPTERCITEAVRRWTFPAPEGGGEVTVNYPFTLRSG